MQNDEQTQDDSLEIELEEVAEDEATNQSETSQEEDRDWKAEAKKWRAEAFKLKNEGKPHKANAEKKESKSEDFDYGEYAFLAQKGIESDDEIAFVKERMKDSGKSLRDTLNASWFKAELAERQALSKTADATPKGTSAKGTATDSVDYWMAKPISEVPQEMRAKVVNAKLDREKSTGVFYNS